MSDTQPIRFFHRGQIVELDRVEPTRSVLDWLREDARCTGTKEGCNEGDCGACTVVIGELPQHADGAVPAVRGLALKTVNACMQFVPALHGKALFTVEDLKACHGGTLHPVQQALVQCHGSQCGFCTPGFVMSLWPLYEQHAAAGSRPTRQQLADELSGNLCRCTGYRPILDAGQRMFELPGAAFDTAPAIAALERIGHEDHAHGSFHAPTTVSSLAALLERKPQARILAGGTDIGVWVTKQFRELDDIVYVGDVDELKRVVVADGELRIGAGVSLETAWRALAERLPSLTDLWLRFASPPIRHAGTLGGNIANGSPIGDGAPALIALDAQVELRRGERVRRLPLADFHVDYMKNRLEPGEFVQALAVPLATMQRELRAYKISKRYDSDISAVCAVLAIARDGERVEDVRLVFGGMAAIVKRAPGAEAAIAGRPWTEAAVRAAQAALADDFKPLTDMRASAGYRLRVAQNLLWRFWLETRGGDPLPPEAVNVWSSVERTPAVVEGAQP
ncbi:xanthine dehydrogenase small subunit [Piscinibacter sp. XHJ-5]|uniref:xanthine dehydrogenase small subunit n=1 Tax=Piscinibacter sp. XHJ-5 TaxID=3037797 RepID=UPI002452E803|nr:xanthine dehydrogenase small subunit [Piscinibacter sp. XHJ-5]